MASKNAVRNIWVGMFGNNIEGRQFFTEYMGVLREMTCFLTARVI